MILKFEAQKIVASNLAVNVGSMILLSKGQGPKNTQKKQDPKKGYCADCNIDGHIKDNCFKLIGYPDW